MRYPKTPKRPAVDKLHGREVTDDYRWLEKADSSEVLSWVKQQNELTQEYFSSTVVEEIYEELLQEHDVFSRGVPYRCGVRYYWYERQPGQQHPVLFSALDPRDETDKQVVFDVNLFSEDGSIAATFFQLSRNGRSAVYALQEKGSEYDRVFIRDLVSGEDAEFYHGRVFSMDWCEDERGFYYMCSNYQAQGGDETDESHYQQIYYHRLGEPRGDDKLIFDAHSQQLPKDAWLDAHDSQDGRYVAINAGVGWSEQHVFLHDRESATTVELLPELDARSSLVLLDNYIYLDTDYRANNRRLLRLPVEEAGARIEEWEEFVPEDSSRLLDDWTVTQDEILLCYTHNAVDQVERVKRSDGEKIGSLDIPSLSSIGSLATHRDDSDFYYSVTTFFTPSTEYLFNSKAQTSELFYADPRSLDASRYVAEQRWYTSKDGTQVPLFFVAPKDYQNRTDNPVLLTGYGGFATSINPNYVGSLKPWLERSGIIVEPNLRGGGEFGEEWHQAGMRANKQNTFDDFIAAAEYLIDAGVTQPERLIIEGGSNGGLLIGAVITQRPDLFRAAVCAVPLLDMYRYHKFLLAHRWTHEYGHPDKKTEFNWLSGYSPYHQVDDKQLYPSLFLTAGINDSRVHPLHAWKMAAKLQNGHSDNFVLLKTDMAAGHGSGRGFYQAVRDAAEETAFMIDQARLKGAEDLK
ncbi:MAG: prolyl oligopeptidase family serine peptidase [Candidatus Saccharimonadales bacterium]